jgi:hypothetical protein
MSRIVLQLAGATSLALILIGTPAPAFAAERSHSFKLRIVAVIDVETQGKNQKVDADTVLKYTWKQRGGERALHFDSALVKAKKDGDPFMDTFMSRARVTNTEAGKTTEVSLENAPGELKQMMQDSFGVPLCKLRVDETGKEVKREIVAGPGAKTLLEQGMIANARLFHPPFVPGKDEWSAATEVSMGNGGFAKGELTYKKGVRARGRQVVKVSGTLTNDGFKSPDTMLTFKNVKYVVSGEQTYDPSAGEWVSGKLLINVLFQLTRDALVGSAKGNMVLSFDEVPGKK